MQPTHGDVFVSFSGGLDSTVLLAFCQKWFRKTTAVSFDYGQRHRKELEAAALITDAMNIPHRIVDLQTIGAAFRASGSKSSLLSMSDVPEGHYAAENMVQTIVPNRNAIFIAVLTGMAVSAGANNIALATHSGDHAIYPDCRPEFVSAMETAMRWANDLPSFQIWAPFIHRTKADIAKLGADYDAPMAMSRSCYNSGTVHCGRCGTCVERIEAFIDAEIDDPTEYDPEGFQFAIHTLATKGASIE